MQITSSIPGFVYARPPEAHSTSLSNICSLSHAVVFPEGRAFVVIQNSNFCTDIHICDTITGIVLITLANVDMSCSTISKSGCELTLYRSRKEILSYQVNLAKREIQLVKRTNIPFQSPIALSPSHLRYIYFDHLFNVTNCKITLENGTQETIEFSKKKSTIAFTGLFSRNEKIVLLAFYSGELYIWNLETKKETRLLTLKNNYYVSQMQFLGNQQYIIAFLKHIDATIEKKLVLICVKTKEITECHFAPDDDPFHVSLTKKHIIVVTRSKSDPTKTKVHHLVAPVACAQNEYEEVLRALDAFKEISEADDGLAPLPTMVLTCFLAEEARLRALYLTKVEQ